MINKHWFISQNNLTPDVGTIFFHFKNLPGLLMLIVFAFFWGIIAFIPCIVYFAIMLTVSPPTIMEKDRTIYAILIQKIDRLLKKINLEKTFFKIMNS